MTEYLTAYDQKREILSRMPLHELRRLIMNSRGNVEDRVGLNGSADMNLPDVLSERNYRPK